MSNEFERTREAAWRLHEKAGFQLVSEENGIVTIVLSRERYLERRGKGDPHG